jgi:hypothetical protein
MRYFILCFTLFIIISCQNKEKPTHSTATAAPSTAPYPTVTQAYLEKIVRNGDHIDIVFYKYPISISRDGNADIIQELGRVTDQPPQAAPGCQADGRIFYNGKGQTIAEADIYIQPGCYYVVFYENGKPAYSNGLTPEAIKFYEDLTKQFRQ